MPKCKTCARHRQEKKQLMHLVALANTIIKSQEDFINDLAAIEEEARPTTPKAPTVKVGNCQIIPFRKKGA